MIVSFRIFGDDLVPSEITRLLRKQGSECDGQPFIGPGSAEHWRHPDLGAILWQVIAIPLFPLTLLYGLIRWASFHIKSKPVWPREVLASVGGAPLHGSALEAWRHVVPDRAAGAAAPLPSSASASGATAHRE
ncbi:MULTISPECIES: hypothetical protein [unclassified Xanthomonas]|uniref:hypothetical protein n=1 Tax=unclassified Xanthomonas TaxID=2643310 RepID=UPI002A80DF28|nr:MULTISPECIES: hypothetical protein [unclassified Xanthomonas]MDY4295899.1 hypothetical protein [Xanthomonas sp. LF02-5]MDY4357694.1 hypothetical protein [Xanthomonas sp. LF04-12]